MSPLCPSCCQDCTLPSPLLQSSSPTSPYALSKLLQAGTLALHVSSGVKDQICDHTHAEDGWHVFNAQALVPHLLDSTDAAFCHELDFLIKQRFVSITYSSVNSGQLILLRLYLIPYDLSDVQGKLHVRKETILNPAKRYMRTLLPKITRDIDAWFGAVGVTKGKDLVEDTKVRWRLF